MQDGRPQLVIFDCDGVLVDSEPAINEVLAANLTGHGLAVSHEDCMRMFMGLKMSEIADQVSDRGITLPQDWVEEVYRDMYARLRQGVPVVEGIHHVLEHLEMQDIDYCVASNGSDEKMSITLGHTGLWDRFSEVLFSAHTHGVAKPDPRLFQIAADRFGAAYEHCVVVEDSVPGSMAAKRAGMRCLGYAAHGDGAALKAQGATVFHDMTDVVNLLYG